MVKVKMLTSFVKDGLTYGHSTVADVDQDFANSLVEANFAVIVSKPKAKRPAPKKKGV